MSRRGTKIAAIVAIFAVVFVATAGAAMAVVQSGRHSAWKSFDGVVAHIEGESFHPDAGDCVLYSTLAYDPTDYRQLETGLVRCNGTSIDGTCNNVIFVETWRGPGNIAGTNYKCYVHGSFYNTSFYRFELLRESASSDIFDVYLFASMTHAGSLGSMDPAHNLQIWAWGEHTPHSNCDGYSPAVGHFKDWQKFFYGSGWSYLSGTVSQQCSWLVSSISSTGDFSVSK